MQKHKHGIALWKSATLIQTYLIGKTLQNVHVAAFKIVWKTLTQQRHQIGIKPYANGSAVQ